MHEKKPHGIRAEFFNNLRRVGVIFEALAHFFAVRGKHYAAYDAILKSGLVKKSCREYRERVKPPARLVKSLGDKIRRKVLFKIFFVFKRIVVLRVGHRARLKPAVKHFGHAAHGSPARAGNRDAVNKVLVQVAGRFA